MQKKLTLLFSFLLIAILALPESKAAPMSSSEIRQLYENLQLQNEVSYKAFNQAVTGYHKINVKKAILTLIDFSKASTEERLYVIDMEKKAVLFKSHVAHGKNSGGNYATSFSNEKGSNQSSLGFFLTENTYQGKNGLSLIINGLENGINDRAKTRAVVIHGADYANPKQAKALGRLGRSFGCPALPRELTQPIINTIKDGSLLYIYSESHNEEYLKSSRVI
ncbi:MAG: murein L,D-transpeptidase catalytic domain family protein [Candidatus Symbiothrix sp.]|jgi:hypothetical protein|nr:murein L,D-transpeptidase catalytic domain family protein [Candidatus Symbiothrix sp.]